MRPRYLSAALALACCCLLAACGGPQSTLLQPSKLAAPLAGFLPAPSTLAAAPPAARAGSYLDSDLVRDAAIFSGAGPHQRVSAMFPALDFTPDFPSASNAGAAGLAYAVFSFDNLQGYDRDEVVNCIWDVATPAGNCFIGLANWGRDRWDWAPLDTQQRASFTASPGGPLDPYIDFGGGLLLVVLLRGTDSARLHQVRIGTLPPTAALSATPASGLAPLNVMLDASDSSDSDGSIVHYEWDLEGNGSFETDGGTQPTIEHSYNSGGSFNPVVKVTDNFGASDTATLPVTAFAEWNHSWGESLDDSVEALLVNNGTIYAGGNSVLVGDNAIFLRAYNLDGSLKWAKSWNSGGLDLLSGIAASSDGATIYTCGMSAGASNGTLRWLLQAWEPDGSLLWSKRWGGDSGEICRAICVTSDAVFLCGTTASFGIPKSNQAAIVRFTLDGDKVWQRIWGGTGYDGCEDACIIPAILGSPTIGMLGDTDSFGAGSRDLLFLGFNFDGELLSSRTWGDANLQQGSAICSSFVHGTYVTGTDGSAPPRSILLRVQSGAPALALQVESSTSCYFQDLAINGDEIYFTGMSVQPTTADDLIAGRVNVDGSGLHLEHIARMGIGQFGSCVALLPDGSPLFAGKQQSASDISWALAAGSSADRGAVQWQSVDQSASVISAAVTSLDVAATDSAGVADSGGGQTDAYLGVHKL